MQTLFCCLSDGLSITGTLTMVLYGKGGIILFVCIAVVVLLCGFLYILETSNTRQRINVREGVIPLRFILIAGVWGLCFSFIIIPWQTPDEYTHLRMIGREIRNESFAELLLNDMPLDKDRIIFNSDEKVDAVLYKTALVKRPEYSIRDCMPRGISVKCVKHLPATIGIMLGIVLKLPTYWVLQLGELFALVFYIWVCSKALLLTPIKKEIFEIIMLLPMSIQQAASINYDAVLLPLCFFLTAYILHLKFEVNEVVNLKSIAYIIGMLLIIAIIKLPYIILGGIFFMVPLDKINIKMGSKYAFTIKNCLKNRMIIVITVAITACFALFVLRDNEYVRLLTASVLEWQRTIYLLKTTLETFSDYLLVSTIGKFGWLDAPLPLFYVCLLTSIILIFSISDIRKEDINNFSLGNIKFKAGDRLILLLVVLVLSYLITIALVGHTFLMGQYGTDRVDNVWINYREALYQIPYIGGIQGRYYIPALLPLLLIMPSIFEIERNKYDKVFTIIECVYILCTSQCVILRYW